MNRARANTLAGLLCALTMYPLFAIAQVNGVDLNDPEMQKAIRGQYVGSPNLPDGIAYISTLRMIADLNADDPETAEALIVDKMGLEIDAAREFAASLVASLEEFDARMDKRGGDIACDNGVPRAFGDDAFLLLDAIDDVSDAVSQQHFVEFKQTLGNNTAARLQAWVNASKRNINHIKFDQKKLALQTGISNVDAELSALCNALEQAKGGSKR